MKLIKNLLALREHNDHLIDSFGEHEEEGQDYYVHIATPGYDFRGSELDSNFRRLKEVLERVGFRLKGWGGNSLEVKNDNGINPENLRELLHELRTAFPKVTFELAHGGVHEPKVLIARASEDERKKLLLKWLRDSPSSARMAIEELRKRGVKFDRELETIAKAIKRGEQ